MGTIGWMIFLFGAAAMDSPNMMIPATLVLAGLALIGGEIWLHKGWSRTERRR